MKIKILLFAALFLSCLPNLVRAENPDQSGELEAPHDSTEVMPFIRENEASLESKVRSTLMFGGSTPVAFNGEARLKIAEHNFDVTPDYAYEDKSWVNSNWEGNESMLRLGMIVRPNRNAVLWAKLGFQHTLPGNYVNPTSIRNSLRDDTTGVIPVQTRHDKSNVLANIHEDMSAGLAIRSKPVSFWVKMGNVMWNQASPLTIWKSQNRTFAWDYMPYEIEQPIARYYEYNVAKGKKIGRAAWNKKAFNGVQIESIHLPWNLYFNALYANHEDIDKLAGDFADWGNDAGYADGNKLGVSGVFNKMGHVRLEKRKIAEKYDLGLNYVGTFNRPDMIFNDHFRTQVFTRETELLNNNTQLVRNVFHKEANIYSTDMTGPINQKLRFKADFAFSMLDTSFATIEETNPDSMYVAQSRVGSRPVTPAFYGELHSDYLFPAELSFGYIPVDFYSPFSFVTVNDAFFPLGANRTGSGAFIGESGQAFIPGTMGGMLSLKPEIGYGHITFQYGQYTQMEASRDLLFFPYRLNGSDFYSFFQTSYTRWANGTVDQSLEADYGSRLGDNRASSGAGALYTTFQSAFEGFVAYEDSAQADANITQPLLGMTEASPFVPRHKKWSYHTALDISYDVSDWVRYPYDLFLSGYVSLSGVSTGFKPISLDQKEMMLWSSYIRFDPAVAITPNFYILALLGWEIWRSDMAYMNLNNIDHDGNPGTPALNGFKNIPIDYTDFAWGIGFDWEILPRVGLHGRLKFMEHSDEYFPINNWTARSGSGEIKMWF